MKEQLNMESIRNTYMDELIRENARLTVQLEARDQIIATLQEDVAKAKAAGAAEAVSDYGQALERANKAEARLRQAEADLLFVMGGGEPCDVCAKVCTFGSKDCKPVWRCNEKAGCAE